MLNKSLDYCQSSKGFTLIELIMVMILVGILSVAIIPRFANKNAFDERGFFDQSISMVRYAQKVAIAQHTDVFVNVTPGTICLTYVADPNCASTTASEKVLALSPMPLIGDQSWMQGNVPAGMAFGTVISFSFSALGKPNFANTTIINLNGSGTTQSITVERETGYVH